VVARKFEAMTGELLLLLASVFAAMLGFGITLPVLPFHIDRLALAEGASPEAAALHVGAITGIFALAQAVSAPLWGRLSDRTGRRLPLVLGLAGNAVSLGVFGLASSLPLLYGSRVLGGTFAGAIVPAVTAYVSDVTDQRSRGRALAWVGSAGSLGIVLGPALGAFLAMPERPSSFMAHTLKLDGFSLPFLAAAFIVAATSLVAARGLPESPGGAKPANQSPAASQPMRASAGLRWLLTYAFLAQFGLALFEGTFALHASAEMGLGPRGMGVVFATCGLVMAGMQATVVAWLFTRVAEPVLVGTGFLVMGVGLALLMLSRELVPVLIYVSVFALGTALVTPSLVSMASKLEGGRTGAALGLQNASGSIGQAVGPPVGAALLPWSVHAPYFLAAVLLAVAAIAWTSRWFMSHRAAASRR
jgi:DHA1 family multidrug resistance protein-like MFS transporter